MSDGIQVSPAALRAYGETADGISGQLAAAGAFDLAGNIAAMVPVFGLIGQDFLVAFGGAQANHAKVYAEVAATFGHRAQLAGTSANAYETSDANHADALRAIGKER